MDDDDLTAQNDPARGGELRLLPLHREHGRLCARFAPFAGWSMPLLYTSIIDEHFQVRHRAGLFDVSHMGRLFLRGPLALRALERLVASNLSRLAPGEARYTVLLTPWGGVLDDLIVYRRADGLQLVVNAARTAEDRSWIEEHLPEGTTLDDLTELTALLALQGPAALDVLARLGGPAAVPPRAFTFTQAQVAGVEATVMRTGYTGEEGVEFMVDGNDAPALWHALLAADADCTVRPCGLGARDTLRLEAALLLYGQDLTKNTTPFEARLGWLTDVDRSDFMGREALLEAKAKGPEKLLVGLRTTARSIPRPGDEIAVGDLIVGKITSGSVSPVLGHPIALGYVLPRYAGVGTEVLLLVRGAELPAQVVERPFYRRGVTPVPNHVPRSARTDCPGDAEGAEA
ncbi:MAG: glycine cleavage system aminomethyltransferase GcvT [Thermoleophilia bacterium]